MGILLRGLNHETYYEFRIRARHISVGQSNSRSPLERQYTSWSIDEEEADSSEPSQSTVPRPENSRKGPGSIPIFASLDMRDMVYGGSAQATTSRASEELYTSPQIIGDIPTSNELSNALQWTGGTLNQLRTTLQEKECTANNIFLYNQEQDKWFLYSQTWPNSFNQEFYYNYPDRIPETTIYVSGC